MKEHTYRTRDGKVCEVCGQPPTKPFTVRGPDGTQTYTIATHPLLLPQDGAR